MPNDLYEHDILLWSEQQADLLRRVASGEPVTGIDWPNIIEEVADVGGAALHNVRSLLRQAMVRLLKTHLLASAPDPGQCPGEVDTLLADAELWCCPSMRQRIDLEELWQRATTRVLRNAGARSVALSEQCPWTLDDLLSGDIDALLAALANAHLAKPPGTP